MRPCSLECAIGALTLALHTRGKASVAGRERILYDIFREARLSWQTAREAASRLGSFSRSGSLDRSF